MTAKNKKSKQKVIKQLEPVNEGNFLEELKGQTIINEPSLEPMETKGGKSNVMSAEQMQAMFMQQMMMQKQMMEQMQNMMAA